MDNGAVEFMESAFGAKRGKQVEDLGGEKVASTWRRVSSSLTYQKNCQSGPVSDTPCLRGKELFSGVIVVFAAAGLVATGNRLNSFRRRRTQPVSLPIPKQTDTESGQCPLTYLGI